MKKISKIIISLFFITIISLITNIQAVNLEYKNYTNDEYEQKVKESVTYAMSLIDDNMTDHEKALVFANYVQEGNIYAFSPNNQTERGVLVDHAAVCAGYASAYKLLLNTARNTL